MRKGGDNFYLLPFSMFALFEILNDSLCHHGFGYFHETCDVGSFHIVDVSVRFGSVFYTLSVNVAHDLVQTLVNFFGTP